MFKIKLWKLVPILSILILSLALIGCQTKTANKIPTLNLPEMPMMEQKVIDEVKCVCIPRNKCDNLNNWLNELYIFRVKYNIYKEELQK